MLRCVAAALVLCPFAVRAAERSTLAGVQSVRLPVSDGKDLRFTHFSTEEGLSQSRVDHILQDDVGFLWIGTYNGLNRYDGYHFRIFKPKAHEANSIGGVFITTLFQDRSGAMWIGVAQQLDRFDPVTETFTHFRADARDPSGLSDHVEHMTQDRDGMLWLATRSGLDRMDPASHRVTHYRNDPKDPESLSSDDVRYVFEDRQGTLWVATAGDLNAFDRKTGKVRRYPNFRETPLDRVYEDRSGVLWVSSTRAGGVATLDRETGKFTHYTFYDEGGGAAPGIRWCAGMLEDRHGTLWLATKPDGLVQFDRAKRRFIRYRNDPGIATSLNNNDALSLTEDREGGIWVGTDGGGLNRFASGRPPFTIYRREPGNRNSLDQSYTLSVFEDSQGVLWIGSTSLLNRLDRKTGRYTQYQHDPANAASISNGTVHAIAEDASGTLWFGTWGGGLNRFDRRTGRFQAYRHRAEDPASLSHDYILSLLIDRGGSIWAGTEDGLNRFDPRTERFTVWRGAGDRPENRFGRVLAEGPDGSMWIGTYEAGLLHLDARTGKAATYSHDPTKPRSLSSNRVNALCVDRTGALWAGTQNGLDRFDASTGEFEVLHEADGLPNNAVQGILEDAAGNLWLGTGNGLSKFDPRARSFQNYYADDGLAGDEFNNSSVYFRSAKGEMFFGGVNGVTAFRPEEVIDSRFVPPVVLTNFKLFSKEVLPGTTSPLRKSITSTASVTLTHNSIFELEFAALSFASPGRNRYRYKLEGLQQAWIEADANHRFGSYSTLDPGEYVFRVQGSSSREVWNEQGITLKIRIPPPWWSTWWFRLAAAAFTAMLIWYAHHRKVRGIERHNRELALEVEQRTAELKVAKEKAEAASEAKTTFVANMSHELRTPLTAILGFSQLLARKAVTPEVRHDLRIISKNGEQLLALINQVLDLSKIESGRATLNEQDMDLRAMLETLEDSFAVKAAEKGLEFEFAGAGGVPRYIRADQLKLRQVLTNLLGNAIKFTARGSVKLRAWAASPAADGACRLGFAVTDTGPGIAAEELEDICDAFVQSESGRKSQEGTGLGLTISSNFVKLMGGELRVESRAGEGTTASFEIPAGVVERLPIEAETAPHEVVVAPGQEVRRILVVDDRWSVRQLVTRLLEPAGLEVREAADGRAALDAWREWRPHLIFMDVRMPVMDGYAAVRQIRAEPGGKDAVVVALTASVFVLSTW